MMRKIGLARKIGKGFLRTLAKANALVHGPQVKGVGFGRRRRVKRRGGKRRTGRRKGAGFF